MFGCFHFVSKITHNSKKAISLRHVQHDINAVACGCKDGFHRPEDDRCKLFKAAMSGKVLQMAEVGHRWHYCQQLLKLRLEMVSRPVGFTRTAHSVNNVNPLT